MWCCNNTLSETPTFYINYEECKYKCAVIDKLQQTGFILTMRNVNLGKGQKEELERYRFILTMRNVNH